MATPDIQPEVLYTDAAAALMGVSRTHFEKRVKEGAYPAPNARMSALEKRNC